MGGFDTCCLYSGGELMSSVLLGNHECLFEKETKQSAGLLTKILSIFLWDVYFEEWKLRFSWQATNNKC